MKAVNHKFRASAGRRRNCDNPLLRQRGGNRSPEAKRWKKFRREEKKARRNDPERLRRVAEMTARFFTILHSPENKRAAKKMARAAGFGC